MRILMLADTARMPNSGAAGTEIRLAEEFSKLVHEVEQFWDDSLPHHIRHWNLYHLLEQPRAMRRFVSEKARTREYDVYHVNQPACWLAAREHRKTGRSGLFVHRSHGYEPRIGKVLARWRHVYPEDVRPLHRKLATRVLGYLLQRNYRGVERYAEAHVVSCSECADYLVEKGVPSASIHVSPQAPLQSYLDLPPLPMSRERLRRVLYVGQHAFIKAPMVVASVLEALLTADPETEASWVCESGAHSAVRAHFSAPIRARVNILGWMPQDQLRAVYDHHGIFLFPSFTEGFGKAFLEAMARGLCVVATGQGGARDVITHEKDGLIAPVGDISGLVAHVRRLAGNSELAEGISAAARRKAEQYAWTGVAEALLGFYRERLDAKRRAHA